MKEAKSSYGTMAGIPNTKGAAGSKVSNRAVTPKAVSSSILSRMNGGSKKGGK